MRLARVLALAFAVLASSALALGPTEAADLAPKPGSFNNPPAPPPARTPSILRGGDPGLLRSDDDRRGDGRRGDGRPHHPGHQQPVFVVPQTVFVTPGRCWQPGYWTYQWVPQTYTYNTWVAGQWSSDGYWIDGHYAPSQYSTGYYQPLWVEGYYSGC